MSVTYITAALRRKVKQRAENRCEYCYLHSDDATFTHEVDHIIAERHGGAADESNLAFACFLCNRNKGTDFASILPDTKEIIRLYDPRTDIWQNHFRFREGDPAYIEAITMVGIVTERMLGFNTPEQLEKRRVLVQIGTYPPPTTTRLA